MSPRFEKKNVFLTAAGAGFGYATAVAFAREGAAAVCVVERLADRLDGVVAAVQAHGARAVPIQADLGDTPGAEAALAQALDACGQIDVGVLNHAAMSWFTPFLELSDEAWETELSVNLTSHFVLARGLAKAMADAGGGAILFTASVNALGAGKGFAPYCVTKSGLVALCQVMAVELAPLRIRVNCVSPGPADTQRSVDLVGEETMQRFRQSFPGVPMNRLAAADDIAEAFLYLASDAAAYVTGQNLVVDGGLTAQIYDLPEE
jgi:NAD(P)-dependent dehydrogenase (short-subunit alcohol dehydrogenase family)